MSDKEIGRFYYLTDLSKKDSYPNLIRQIEPHPWSNPGELNFNIIDEVTFQPKYLNGSNGLDPEDRIIFKMTEEELNSNYVSIAPQMIAYLVGTKDEDVMSCLQLVIVPYDFNLQKRRVIEVRQIRIYEALAAYWSSRSVTDFALRFKDDETLTSLNIHDDDPWTYKIIKQLAVYHTDNVDFLLDNTLYKVEPDKDALIKKRDEFSATGHTKITTALMSKEEAFFNLRSLVVNEMNRIMKVMPITLQEVMNLKKFMISRSFENEDIVNIISKVIDFEKDPYMNVRASSSEVYDDPVMKSSLIIFPYSFTLDLDKIKNDNKLYNMVVAKCETGQEYVIMFRKKPIEYRKEEETGFKEDELKKLLHK